MIIFRKLEKQDEKSLLELINKVEQHIENKDWWLPLTNEDKFNFFNKDKMEFYGLFHDGKLIAASALTFFDDIMLEIVKHVKNINLSKLAKIGRCVVLPKYQGNNYMYKINSEILKCAKAKGYKHLLAIAHPNNIASNKSLQKLGMQVMKQFITSSGYLRNLYFMEI